MSQERVVYVSMSQPFITHDMIRQHAGPEIIRRGEEYFRRGAVGELIRRGNTLQAEVEGSDIEPYQVTVTLGADGEIEADCTCPYEWGEWCKHIVATLLAYQQKPQTIEERPSLASLLAPLDAQELRSLLQALAAQHPDLIAEIEMQVSLRQQKASASSQTAGIAPIDPNVVRQQARQALHNLNRRFEYEGYGSIRKALNNLRSLVRAAQERLEANDGRSALTILEAITEACLKTFEYWHNEEGEVGDFYVEIGPLWTEAILTADLSQQERQAWAGKLQRWRKETEDFGIDDFAFEPAAFAAEVGWDLDAARQKQAQEADEEWDEDDEEYEDGDDETDWEDDEGYEQELADLVLTAQLNVLERQGRLQEALQIAEASGRADRAAALLVRLGQVAEAVKYALRSLTTSDQALYVARILREHQANAEALQIAERGLNMEGYDHAELGRWLRDFAASQGRTDLAIKAGMAAIKETPVVQDYKRLQEIAGDRWPKLQTDLLTYLAEFTSASSVPGGVVEILLYEGLMEPALAAVRKTHDYALMGRVVEAATPTHPEEVIALCKSQAEPIMEEGRSDLYDVAASWLSRAKAAYLAADQKKAWQDYLTTLRNQHQRKYKLMGLLKPLAGD